MIKVNVYDAKTNLSDYLKRVEQGETVMICRRNIPIAEMHAPRGQMQRRGRRRKPGWGREIFGPFDIPDSAFFDPMPDEFLKAFYGE